MSKGGTGEERRKDTHRFFERVEGGKIEERMVDHLVEKHLCKLKQQQTRMRSERVKDREGGREDDWATRDEDA